MKATLEHIADDWCSGYLLRLPLDEFGVARGDDHVRGLVAIQLRFRSLVGDRLTFMSQDCIYKEMHAIWTWVRYSQSSIFKYANPVSSYEPRHAKRALSVAVT